MSETSTNMARGASWWRNANSVTSTSYCLVVSNSQFLRFRRKQDGVNKIFMLSKFGQETAAVVYHAQEPFEVCYRLRQRKARDRLYLGLGWVMCCQGWWNRKEISLAVWRIFIFQRSESGCGQASVEKCKPRICEESDQCTIQIHQTESKLRSTNWMNHRKICVTVGIISTTSRPWWIFVLSTTNTSCQDRPTNKCHIAAPYCWQYYSSVRFWTSLLNCCFLILISSSYNF